MCRLIYAPLKIRDSNSNCFVVREQEDPSLSKTLDTKRTRLKFCRRARIWRLLLAAIQTKNQQWCWPRILPMCALGNIRALMSSSFLWKKFSIWYFNIYTPMQSRTKSPTVSTQEVNTRSAVIAHRPAEVLRYVRLRQFFNNFSCLVAFLQTKLQKNVNMFGYQKLVWLGNLQFFLWHHYFRKNEIVSEKSVRGSSLLWESVGPQPFYIPAGDLTDVGSCSFNFCSGGSRELCLFERWLHDILALPRNWSHTPTCFKVLSCWRSCLLSVS